MNADTVGPQFQWEGVHRTNSYNLLFEGHMHVILGDSGSGKTTLVEALVGVSNARRSWNNKALCRKEMLGIASYPFKFKPDPSLTCEEICTLYQTWCGRTEEERTSLIQQLGLTPCLKRRFGRCSSGEQRRVCLVIGLLLPQPLMILDEPTRGLSDRDSLKFILALRSVVQKKGNQMVLCILHRARNELLEHFDSITLVKRNVGVAYQGDSLTVRESHGSILRFIDIMMDYPLQYSQDPEWPTPPPPPPPPPHDAGTMLSEPLEKAEPAVGQEPGFTHEVRVALDATPPSATMRPCWCAVVWLIAHRTVTQTIRHTEGFAFFFIFLTANNTLLWMTTYHMNILDDYDMDGYIIYAVLSHAILGNFYNSQYAESMLRNAETDINHHLVSPLQYFVGTLCIDIVSCSFFACYSASWIALHSGMPWPPMMVALFAIMWIETRVRVLCHTMFQGFLTASGTSLVVLMLWLYTFGAVIDEEEMMSSMRLVGRINPLRAAMRTLRGEWTLLPLLGYAIFINVCILIRLSTARTR